MTRQLDPRSVEARLADYYQMELQDAQADAESLLWHRRREPAWTFRLLVVIMAGVLVGVIVTQLTELPSPISSASQSEAPTVELGEDGIPTSIDGASVLRGPSINEAVAGAKDDQEFLIAGWLVFIFPDCVVASPTSDLLDPCHAGPFLVDQAPTGTPGPTDMRLVIDRLVTPPEGQGPFVFQVHTRDSAAGECPLDHREECEHALVVDAIVWSS
jgi:hypothetical protein